MSTENERRRYRRVPLTVSVLAKRFSAGACGVFEPGTSRDISLAGVYFTTTGTWQDVQAQEMLTLSIAVPREQGRDFPFARLAGRGRVVRVDSAPPDAPKPQVGIAVEFADDLTVLTAAPEHGW